MHLNTLKPTPGSRRKKVRVGRGIGSGFGKTAGRGHKGQKSRSGGRVKPGFEGGQMPLQRRLPKFGFTSRKSRYVAEVRLSELDCLTVDEVSLEILKEQNIVKQNIKKVKVISSGELNKSIVIKGLAVTKGARQMIEQAGGSIEE